MHQTQSRLIVVKSQSRTLAVVNFMKFLVLLYNIIIITKKSQKTFSFTYDATMSHYTIIITMLPLANH